MFSSAFALFSVCPATGNMKTPLELQRAFLLGVQNVPVSFFERPGKEVEMCIDTPFWALINTQTLLWGSFAHDCRCIISYNELNVCGNLDSLRR
jgi:hypothetical protein